MKILTAALVPAIALLGAATSAGAVTYFGVLGSPDKGATGQTILVNFDDPIPAGYSLKGDYMITNTTSSAAAAPAGDTTKYLYTSPKVGTGVATLTTIDLSSISFYWGSIDDYNAVDVLGADGVTLATIKGTDISPADGNQGLPHTNERVFINAGTDEVITGLRFHATGIAYEIDDVAGTLAGPGNPSTVPEPATWGLMIAGFGMVGVGARRRRNAALRVSA